ncbi:MAG: AAA family ATPase [Hydrogenophaga sp.]|uniref:AAA family ATPase n=1 Tax=Hydrogenophaga sp. TaxID=1904254 RepID=UPI001D4E4EBE|nr:AAA family ATPase [Hydrogenophaga sp.]MBX3609198.1 AAA family ATPase [Hydrogenophaga sp.]
MDKHDHTRPSAETAAFVQRVISEHLASEAAKASPRAAEAVPPIAARTPSTNFSRYHPYTSDQFGAFPEIEFAVDDVFPMQGIGVIYGPSQSGKSALALSLVDALVRGTPWFGRETKQRCVWYVALEGQSGLRSRVKALELHEGAQLPENARFLFDSLNLASDADVAALKSKIRANGGADVLMIDTLACAMAGGDENSSRDMGQVVAAAKELQSLMGGLVLLVHHTGKDASRGMRGHSSLHAALDVAIQVQRHDDHRTWMLTKARDSEDGVEGAFVLDRVELPPDSKGKPRHSIVVTPIEMPEKEADAPRGPRYKNQRAALVAIKQHIVAESIANGDAPLQPLPWDEAVEIAKEHMEVGPKHQKLRAQEAICGLVKQGFLVRQEDGQLCLPDEGSAQADDD